MIAAVAFCPHPPMIIPQIAAGASPELDTLRTACDQALTVVTDSSPGLVVLLGDGAGATRWSEGDAGSMAGFGVDLTVPLGRTTVRGRVRMPLSLTIGAWLLARSPYRGERVGFSIPAAATDAELRGWAADLNDLDDRVALLVMGDGSARRSTRAPGYLDERAEPFDAAVATALRTGDPVALRGLAPELGAALLAAGTAPWRLAGHATAPDPYRPAYQARLLYDAAPYGVGYLVASWQG